MSAPTSRSEDSLASLLLTSRLVSEGVLPLKASEYWPLCAQVGRPGVLLGLREAPLVGEHGLDGALARRVVALLARATSLAFELERLDQSGISTLTPFDPPYPARLVERLGPKAPPLLYGAGPLDLLLPPCLGVVGDGPTDIAPDTAEAARTAAACGARLRMPVVCGGGRGVGREAMAGAWSAGGAVVAMLADPLVATLRSPDVRRAVHRGELVLCTPYGPDVPFSEANALGRNRLVHAQSLVTLVVACDLDRGSTWTAAVEALEQGVGAVAVWRGAGDGPGNAALEGRGATPVRSIEHLESILPKL